MNLYLKMLFFSYTCFRQKRDIKHISHFKMFKEYVSTSMKINNVTTRKYYTTILSKDCMSLILQVKYFHVACTSWGKLKWNIQALYNTFRSCRDPTLKKRVRYRCTDLNWYIYIYYRLIIRCSIKISNLVSTTRFWNKHHQVRSISKDWKGK
jgi:hypothetical protein